MCFSANASFGAGVVLAAIGIASVKKVQQAPQIYFATIPLIFSIQQISEGFVWLSLTHPTFQFIQKPSTYIFLYFAQVIWPIWLPLSIMKLEHFKKKQRLHYVFVIIGCLIAFYLGFCMIAYPVQTKITGFHITYVQEYPIAFRGYGEFLYGLSSILPAFLSNVKRMWIIGVTIITSYLTTTFFYEEYIISVWCFFATIISVVVFFILENIKKKTEGWNGYLNPQVQITHH